MRVEIIGAQFSKKTQEVLIYAVDCSMTNLMKLERQRDDFTQKEITFAFSLRDRSSLKYIAKWFGKQKAVKSRNAQTWNQCCRAVVGTITDMNRNYLVA